MKNIITSALILCCVFCSMVVLAQTDMNSVTTNKVLVKGKKTTTQVASSSIADRTRIETIEYLDGLGRLVQTVNKQGSPLKKDVVVPKVYDVAGREKFKYLPYVSSESNGWFKVDPLGSGAHYNFYHGSNDKVVNDDRPFSETIFEASPLNRPLKDYGPGQAWSVAEANKFVEHKYLNYVYGTGGCDDKVIVWEVSGDVLQRNTSVNGGYYPSNALLVKETISEDGKAIREYTNKSGQLILKKVQAATDATCVGSSSDWAQTYYVYDDQAKLRFVMQPELLKTLTTNPTTDQLNQFVFQYKYDARGRMIEKKIPGALPVYMVYDLRDRLALTQDGNQRNNALTNEWTFTKYDVLNRPVLTGKYLSDNGREAMQTAVNNFYASTPGSSWDFFESYNGGSIHGYDNKSFPQIGSADDCYTVTYYDKYDGIAPTGYEFVTGVLAGQDTYWTYPRGLVTGMLVKNLGDGTYLRTVNYYDHKQRIIQSTSQHQKGKVTLTNVLDFAGKPEKVNRKYIVNSTETSITERYVYDHAERLLVTYHSVNGGREVALSGNYYNEISQLVAKGLHQDHYPPIDEEIGQSGSIHSATIETDSYSSSEAKLIATGSIKLQPGYHVPSGSALHARIGFTREEACLAAAGNFKQMIDYEYNIRGWMTKINDPQAPSIDDLFNMELRYNTPTADGGDAQYGGNISEAIWITTGLDKQSYGYKYDAMSRLLKGTYYNSSKPLQNGRYNETLGDGTDHATAYDLNGNIRALKRNGKTGTGTYGLMDDLVYDYTNMGNQLVKVTDAITTNANEGGFKEIETSTDYQYDENGNIEVDENKGVTSIEYNYLNLPSKVSKSATEYLTYSYDATGKKLAQQVFGSKAKTTDYIGELVFENNTLQFVLHQEGRVVPSGSQWDYQYFMKDHLGNTRVTFSSSTSTEQVTATLENNTASAEVLNFRNYPSGGSRSSLNMFDHTDAGTSATYSQLLTGAPNYQIGLAKSYEVNAGDVFDLEAFAKYENTTGSSTNISGILSSLISVFNLPATGGSGLESKAAYDAFTSLYDLGVVVGDETSYEDASAPKAYLNYILFDENFALVDFGFDQVAAGADQNGTHDRLSLHVKAEKKGYLYVFLSNENPSLQNVYFDDLKIVKHSAIQQVADYYPFGLTFNSFQRENFASQDYQYNGKELQDELDLGWLDYGARMYMSDVGRWGVVDPMADQAHELTPFRYSFNNPISFVDPDGRYEVNIGYGQTMDHRDVSGSIDHYGGAELTERDFESAMPQMLNQVKQIGSEWSNHFANTYGKGATVDNFEEKFAEWVLKGLTVPQGNWQTVASVYLPFVGQGPQRNMKQWCVYACAESANSPWRFGIRTATDFAKWQNGGVALDKGPGTVGEWFNLWKKNFIVVGGSLKPADVPSAPDIINALNSNRLYSIGIHESTYPAGYDHNILIQAVERNSNTGDYRYVLMDPNGVRTITAQQLQNTHRRHVIIER